MSVQKSSDPLVRWLVGVKELLKATVRKLNPWVVIEGVRDEEQCEAERRKAAANLESALAECRAASDAVGDDRKRRSISTDLQWATADVLELVKRVIAGEAGSDREVMNAADRIRHRLEDGDIKRELEDAAGGMGSPPAQDSTPEPVWPDYMSANDLAARLGLPLAATRKKLERLAEKYDCRVENESPRRGEPRWFYRVADVLPELRRN